MVIRYRMVGSLSVIFVLMISRSPGGGTVKLRATAAYGAHTFNALAYMCVWRCRHSAASSTCL